MEVTYHTEYGTCKEQRKRRHLAAREALYARIAEDEKRFHDARAMYKGIESTKPTPKKKKVKRWY
jgi:hypothetical protein